MTTSAHKTEDVNRTKNIWFSPFVFTGKEKDSETGFYYFGARYYDPALSGLFLSVDPMADKYPSISPYAYCAWNPVKLVDPEGKGMGDYYNENGKYLGWNGKKDYNVYIVTDDESIKTITNNNKHNRYTAQEPDMVQHSMKDNRIKIIHNINQWM